MLKKYSTNRFKYEKCWVKAMIFNCWIFQNLYVNVHCKFPRKKYGVHHLPSLFDHRTLFSRGATNKFWNSISQTTEQYALFVVDVILRTIKSFAPSSA